MQKVRKPNARLTDADRPPVRIPGNRLSDDELQYSIGTRIGVLESMSDIGGFDREDIETVVEYADYIQKQNGWAAGRYLKVEPLLYVVKSTLTGCAKHLSGKEALALYVIWMRNPIIRNRWRAVEVEGDAVALSAFYDELGSLFTGVGWQTMLDAPGFLDRWELHPGKSTRMSQSYDIDTYISNIALILSLLGSYSVVDLDALMADYRASGSFEFVVMARAIENGIDPEILSSTVYAA